ncbi:alpha/beta hydrolase [Aquiflexum gelatinilyticum]|nr:alpha/beta hydrolase [Aquiflexum gelatinilyticum]
MAPEYKYPEGMKVWFAGLVWTEQNAEKLGFVIIKIIVVRENAGGGMAAKTQSGVYSYV